jgi:hypothetical protein
MALIDQATGMPYEPEPSASTAEIARLRAENERLRAALKEIAEKSEDVEVSAYAWSTLMHMKGADEQSAQGE